MGADNALGLNTVSYNQTVTFTKYVKVILPIDGFVYWIKADQINEGALLNALPINSPPPLDTSASLGSLANTVIAPGSIHITTRKMMEESEVYAISDVHFTSEIPIHEGFHAIGPNCIYIGEFGSTAEMPKTLLFAFTSSSSFYRQENLWHYRGDAVYPWMASQVINSIDGLLSTTQVVSNSLPAFMKLNNYVPFYGFGNSIPLYPSLLIDPNIKPPYGGIHIIPASTVAIGAAPILSRHDSHFQLARERVRITLYGCNNELALRFLDCLYQYSQDYNYIGFADSPIIKDEKVGQTELSVIAMKKSIEFDVNYNQQQMRNLSRQLINQCVPHGIPSGDTVLGTIVGVTPSGYNGAFPCTYVSSTSFTYPLTINPGAVTVEGVFTLEDVQELVAIATTVFAQGYSQAFYVLELEMEQPAKALRL
ncbi:unnamed protein product [Sphagnum balticum]